MRVGAKVTRGGLWWSVLCVKWASYHPQLLNQILTLDNLEWVLSNQLKEQNWSFPEEEILPVDGNVSSYQFPAGLPYGFWTGLANSHNHLIQFLAINLLKYVHIYIPYWLYFSSRTLTDTEDPVGPLILIRHRGGEGRHEGEGPVKNEAEMIMIQPQTKECLGP